MEIEASQSASTDTTTRTLERPSERLGSHPPGGRGAPDAPSKPSAVSVVGRTLAALARWLLFILLIVLAPVALFLWSVEPRVTSPPQLADEAIESGLTGDVRGALVDQLSTNLAEQEDSPLRAAELRPVIERSVSQDWFDGQLTVVAGELDRWLATSSDQLPNLVIDLTEVKESLATDDQSLSLIAGVLDCDDPRCPSPESTLAELLTEIPDEVAFLTIGTESETDPSQDILEARDRFHDIDRLIAIVPLVLAALLIAMVLLARRGTRTRWLGTTLVIIAVPLFAVAMLLPRLASLWTARSLPSEIPLSRASLDEMFTWATRPAGSLARWMLLAGVAALATSITLSLLRRRRA